MVSEGAVRDAMRHVIDPELGINIVDLGLVYGIDVDETRVRISMTMTSPACPLTDYLRDLVDATVRWRVPGVDDVDIQLVREPVWTADMMSAEARHQLAQ
jgi:metal-sulfur cluster biosynthetic enzyme